MNYILLNLKEETIKYEYNDIKIIAKKNYAADNIIYNIEIPYNNSDIKKVLSNNLEYIKIPEYDIEYNIPSDNYTSLRIDNYSNIKDKQEQRLILHIEFII